MTVTFENFNKQLPAIINDRYVNELPSGFMSFEEFEKEFKLGTTSTEQLLAITKNLSQTVHRNIPEGLELLLTVDENVINGLNDFIPSIDSLAPILAERIGKGGRIFLVGSGSSGRVSIDIAAKCNHAFPKTSQQIRGIIAGGDSAIIRAKEGFEDSEADGMKALKDHNLRPNDSVILLSASGSSSFNVGCGNYASTMGASVLYFYNSKNVPARTQKLFDRAIPLCVDIGPQAIAGSTRLQAATLAEAGLGALIVSALYLNEGKEELAKQYPRELASKMKEGLALIRKNFDKIEKIVSYEYEVFSDPRSNFRKLSDETNRGYVTVIAPPNSMREVLIDSTETSPTFSTNPIRRESESNQKRAEFRAYLVEGENNRDAWHALLGRTIYPDDIKDTESFILSCKTEGINSFKNRPIGKGNFLFGVAKIDESQLVPQEIIYRLEQSKKQGGQTALLLICRGKLTKEQINQVNSIEDSLFVMENIPSDLVGFSETIMLKQMLNLISNSSMLLMNKVHGNQMIDVRASNKKLIDRCLRLIKEIWSEYHHDMALTDKELYHYVAHVSAIKKTYEERGIYTPSVVKIILAMLSLKKTPENFQEVVSFLNDKQERIDWIGILKE